jgi:hypothetical protein
MEPEGSLPHSQVPTTCAYPEPDQSSVCNPPPPPAPSNPTSWKIQVVPKGYPRPKHMYPFSTRPVFTVGSVQQLAQTTGWRTTPCRLCVTVYSIYSQLPSILEAVRPSVLMGQLCSHLTNFHEIVCFEYSSKIFRGKIEVWLKSDNNNGHFAWRPIYIYDASFGSS